MASYGYRMWPCQHRNGQAPTARARPKLDSRKPVAVVPELGSTVITAHPPRRLLGFRYRAGDWPPEAGQPDHLGAEWLVLENPAGGARLAC